MQTRGIERVCCLLDDTLGAYDNLIGQYKTAFGPDQVCHAPVQDYSVVDRKAWHKHLENQVGIKAPDPPEPGDLDHEVMTA